MALKQTRILKELKRRAAAEKAAAELPKFVLNEFCFPEQLAFALEKKIIKVACTSRRGGKTNSIIADFGDTCLKENGVTCLYLTLTMRSARSIIWGELKKVAEQYMWNVTTDETRLEMFFLDTKSKIVCGGAKDESEIEKYRGWKLRKAYIDEMQSFRPYVRLLINDILIPALRDLNGELGLTGTPGPVMAGPFFDYCHLPNVPNYHWNAFNNPHMHNPEGLYGLPVRDLNVRLAEERSLKGIDENDPSYIRETFGEWVEDKDSLVFKFNSAKNVFPVLPKSNYDYIFGIDIGWNDSDAIAVLGYNYTDKRVYLVEELIKNKLTISDLVAEINILKAKYSPIKMVMDAGALGKKIQEEIKQRHGLNIEAAEKHRKLEYIELLNDDLRTGKLLSRNNSRFQQDCMLVTWERTEGGTRVVSDAYHSDINDAVLYGWRECKHYIGSMADSRPPARNTKEYMDQIEAKEAEQMEMSKNGDDDIVSDADLEYIFGDSNDSDWN